MIFRRGVLPLASILLLLLAACGGGDDDPKATVATVDSDSSSTTDTDETSTVDSTPDAGDDDADDAPTRTPEDAATDEEDEETENPDGAEPIVECGDLLAPMNKVNALGPDCAPTDIVQIPPQYTDGYQEMTAESADALDDMFAAASADGHTLIVCSSYRSYQTQVDTYNYWVDTLGQEEADRTSARPGHSEHQLGTTVDVQSTDFGCVLDEAWGDTAAGEWLAEHATDHGFVISYPAGTEDITGYAYEPWHIRYVGEDVAADIAESGQTLHEYLMGR